jgi:hypothetical protein
MPATSSNAGLIVPTNAGDSGIWGNELNASIASLDTRLAGTTTILSSVSGLNYTISSADAQCGRVILGGVPAGPATFTFSSANYAMGEYAVWNTSTGFALTCQTPGLGATCTVPAASQRFVTTDGTNAYFADQVPIPVFTFPPLLMNYLSNLIMANDATTPATVLDFAAGMCADATNSVYMQSSTPFTKNAGALWVAGSGNGGMAPSLGLNPNTCYHCFIISNNVTANSSTIDFYFDTSITAANKPANTNYFRRVGSMLTSSGAATWLPFVQNGDTVNLKSAKRIQGTLSGTPTNVTLTVPTGLPVTAILTVGLSPSGGVSGNANLFVYNPNTNNPAAAFSGVALVRAVAPSEVTQMTAQAQVPTNASGQVRVNGAAGDVAATYFITTYGWIDQRGQDGAP